MQLLGDRENDVMVFHGEEVFLARLDPAGFVQGLTLGAVAISARVVPDLCMPTRITLLDMASERRRAAIRDRAHDALLLQQRLSRPTLRL